MLCNSDPISGPVAEHRSSNTKRLCSLVSHDEGRWVLRALTFDEGIQGLLDSAQFELAGVGVAVEGVPSGSDSSWSY